MKQITLVLLAALLLPCSAFSQKSKKQKKQVDALAPQALSLNLDGFGKAFTGLAIFDPSDEKMLFEYNADKYFTPASNTKILTLYASLRTLGDSIPALQYSRQGDLHVFWGTGDPSFLNPHLSQNPQVFSFLKNIAGELLFCPSNFKDQRYGNGWMWSDYPYDYQAEKSPFPVYSNVAHFRQQAREIEVRPSFLKQFLTYDSTLDVEDYVGRAEHDNQFTFNTLAKKGEQFEWHVPFRYTPHFLAEILADTLRRPVHVLEATLPVPPDARILYSVKADSLYALMMQESDNFIAEQLLLLCSWQRSGNLNTAKAIEYSLKNDLASLPDEPKWADGSGLSRYNLATPRSLVAVLHKIYQALPRERLLNIFPAGGVNGTIKSSYKNGGSPFVFAKTGTLRNNHCLSGYLITKKGKLLIFSFMNNNYTGSMSALRREMEAVLRQVYESQ